MIDYKQNYKAIEELVRKRFSLNKESQEKFSEMIMKGTTADEKTRENLDENFRIERNLTINQMEYLDVSWKMFKYYFGEYCVDEGITYSEFLLNSKVVKKNYSKLTKDVKRYYLNNDTIFASKAPYGIEGILIEINNLRLPRKKLKIVLTFNLSDMFMCSTGQDWTSCLNLESNYFGCYWQGLASLPFDTNRCMVYLAPQSQKEYNSAFGITNERMFRRTFGLLDKNNKINLLRWYPNDFDKSNYIPVLNDALEPFLFKKIGLDFEQKNDFDLPTMKITKLGRSISFYIYQDKTFIEEDGTIHFSSEKGNQYFMDDNIQFGPFISCEGGLKKLISLDREIHDFTGAKTINCSECNDRISEDDSYFSNDRVYCYECYVRLQEQNAI